jgi:hypothetical protein
MIGRAHVQGLARYRSFCILLYPPRRLKHTTSAIIRNGTYQRMVTALYESLHPRPRQAMATLILTILRELITALTSLFYQRRRSPFWLMRISIILLPCFRWCQERILRPKRTLVRCYYIPFVVWARLCEDSPERSLRVSGVSLMAC